jgi:hypothetical protein
MGGAWFNSGEETPKEEVKKTVVEKIHSVPKVRITPTISQSSHHQKKRDSTAVKKMLTKQEVV